MRAPELLRRALVLLLATVVYVQVAAYLRPAPVTDDRDGPEPTPHALTVLSGPVDGFTAFARPPAVNAAVALTTELRGGRGGAARRTTNVADWAQGERPRPEDAAGAWLMLSLLAGAASGLVAGFEARRRLASWSAGPFWTAAGVALGPLALVWMWIVVPRSVLEACHACATRRAVDVADCPTCGRAWPVAALPDP